MTLIAFVGSVFSPYYAWARRRGPADPSNHCAINLALHGPGHGLGAKRWTMTERGRGSLSRDSESLTVGPSALLWVDDGLVIDIDEIAAPLPFPVRGRIVLRPEVSTTSVFDLSGGRAHLWWPIAPVTQIDVAFERPALRWRGRGYLDTNMGPEPLESAFTRWTWSRAHGEHGEDETVILYDAVPSQSEERRLALRIVRDGSVELFDPPPVHHLPPGLWRVPRSTRSEPGHEARVVQTLEDGPFYVRSVIASRLLGKDVTAVHESLSLTRFRKTWVQSLLPFRMPRSLS